MAVKLKSNASSIEARAKEVLAFARKHMGKCESAPELYIVIYGPNGKARVTFPKKKELAAFHRSEESNAIKRLIEAFAKSLSSDAADHLLNGNATFTLRLPRSVHQSLLAEAAEEGVTLDQLCLSKLVAQLRELV